MIQVVYGNEPYLIDQVKNKIISSIKNPHMNILRAQTFSEDVFDFLYAYPIFDDKRVALLDIDVLSQLDNGLFNTYISNPSGSSDLFIRVRNFDTRTKFATKLKKMDVVKKCSKLENEDLLKPVIFKVIAECNGRIKEDAYAELIRRENYLDADVNIYNIINDIKSILAVSKDITKELVIRYVKDQETSDVFSFAKLLACKDIAGLRKQSDLVPADNAIQVLSLILREYRIAWKHQLGLAIKSNYAVMKSLPHDKVWRGLSICQSAIDAIKGGALPSEHALEITLLRLVTEAV